MSELSNLESITNQEQLEQFIEKSKECNVFLFKHSTRCPTSFYALEEFARFSRKNKDVICGLINVITERKLSQFLALKAKIEHQSPQVIYFRKQNPVWHASHHEIIEESMQQKLNT